MDVKFPRVGAGLLAGPKHVLALLHRELALGSFGATLSDLFCADFFFPQWHGPGVTTCASAKSKLAFVGLLRDTSIQGLWEGASPHCDRESPFI